MTTQTLRNGDGKDLAIKPGESIQIVAVTGSYTASIIAGVGAPSVVATDATGGNYGPYATGAVVRLRSSALSEIDFDIGTAPEVVSDTPVMASKTLTGGIELTAGGGEVISIDTPAYTWAGKPAPAAGNAGLVVRFTDLNNSLWMSDGATWRPVNGRAVIARFAGSLATPVATVSGAPGKLNMPASAGVTDGAVLIPAGLLALGFGVEANVKLRKTGTGGTWAAAARLGTANTISDSAMVNSSGAATTNNDLWMLGQGDVASSSLIFSPGFATPNAPTTNSFVDRNTNTNTASAMFLSVFATTLNAADSVAMLGCEVAILG